MYWLRLTLVSYSCHIDTLVDFLEKFEPISVSILPNTKEPVFADNTEAPGYWDQTIVSALLAGDIDMDIVLACARNLVGTENIIDHHIEIVREENWIETHKQETPSMVFGNGRLCICPSWADKIPESAAVIILDPGLAFGTGSHSTTALCLEWLAGTEVKNKRVVDYGCGSGVLSLAAATLGAASVYAFDNDPQALTATKNNTERNSLADRIEIKKIGDDIGMPVDILMANILLNPLLSLSDRFMSMVRPGGLIVLSGILSNQLDHCQQVYSSWVAFHEPMFKDEWAMMYGICNLSE